MNVNLDVRSRTCTRTTPEMNVNRVSENAKWSERELQIRELAHACQKLRDMGKKPKAEEK